MGRGVAVAAAIFGLASGCGAARSTDVVPPPPRPAPVAVSSAPIPVDRIDEASTAEVPWYDPDPMLASLRPQARAAADRSGDLPLYDLDVSFAAGGNAFSLTETVWFTEREDRPLDDVVLRLYANAPADGGQKPASIHFDGGSCDGGPPCQVESPSPSVVEAHLARPLPPHGRMRVRLKLSGILEHIDAARTTMMGASLDSLEGMLGGGGDSGGDYGALAVGDGITSLGGFYAVLARRSQGRWQRQDASLGGDLGPDAMSYVRARVELDPGKTLAAAGTTVSDETTTENGVTRRHVTIAAGMVREIALVASSDFAVATADAGGVRVRSFYLPGDAAAGQAVLDAATHALGVFEKRFGPYPYRALDIAEAALVGGAGGVEYSGLATVASMFYRPPSIADMREFCVAHEVAHQWWHALVGSDSRAHPFVDESLAQYSAMLYFEDRYGAARARSAGDMNVKASYETMRLMGEPDGAVDRPVSATSTVGYAGLVYGKGPYFYAAVRRKLGDERFFRALRRYASDYAFGFAGPAAFTTIAASEAGRDDAAIRALARRWLYEAHGDEDLGKPDMSRLLGGMGGNIGGGGSGGTGLPGGLRVDPSTLQQLLESLGAGGLGP